MNVFSTAASLGQAIKNAGRMSEILRILAIHGFAEFVTRARLSKLLPKRTRQDERFTNLPVAERLRMAFEKLGPTFIKFGQLLATRADLLPESFTTEFYKLQDQVGSVPFSDIKELLEKEYRKPLDDVFHSIDQKPLAAASIAQVHAAVLKTGEHVVLKVQRPGIEKLVKTDTSILRALAELLQKHVPEVAFLNLSGMVDEFFRTILWEIDFRVEANNIRRISKNLSSLKNIAIPQVYEHLSTERVLVLERFEGTRFSDHAAIISKGINANVIIERGCDAFFHMVMKDGLFHGDLHGGNLFILDGDRLGIIDFGIVGRLSKKIRESVVTLFISLIDEDYETLASEYAYLCNSEGDIDIGRLQKDLMDLISPYIGMTLGNVNIGQILLRSTAVAARNRLIVPRELMMLFKAMVTIEGLGKSLDPNFDLLPVGNRLAREALASRYNKEQILKDLVVVGRDLQHITESLPRFVKKLMRTLNRNNFTIEVRDKGLVGVQNSLRKFSYFFVHSALSIGLYAVAITFLITGKGPLVFETSVLGLILVAMVIIGQLFALWQLRK